MSSRISKDTPLAELTLRRYEKPSDLKDRDLVRKICLSVGLLQPGDSRDVIVDVLYVLLKARKNKKELNSIEVEDSVRAVRKQYKLPMLGIAGSNIRRQLKRLRELFLIEKIANNYRITEFMPLNEIFEEKIEKYYLKSVKDRVKDYFELGGRVF
jgi:DNA-binding transcriptional ArsR family regulator